ncbi:hypothetical protein ABH947_003464 [Bacillus sp. RC206]
MFCIVCIQNMVFIYQNYFQRNNSENTDKYRNYL